MDVSKYEAEIKSIFFNFIGKIDLSCCEFYTSNLNHKNSKFSKFRVFNITLKSGDVKFAPDSELRNDAKYKDISEEVYVTRYIQLILNRLNLHKDMFEKFKYFKKFTLSCYCGANDSCHRFILAYIMTLFGAKYLGELN